MKLTGKKRKHTKEKFYSASVSCSPSTSTIIVDIILWQQTVAELHSRILDAYPLQGPYISISCNFGENLAKSYVGAPLPFGELVPPLPFGEMAPAPRRNPGSDTDKGQ